MGRGVGGLAAREGAGRLRWPLSAALRSVHKTKDIKSATFDVLAAGSLHGHVCMYVHVRSTLVVCRLYACAVCAPMACRLIWGFGLPLHVLCVRCCASWDFRVPASAMRLQSVPGGVPVPRGASSRVRVGFACFLRVCLLRVYVHGSRRISCTCLE